jgi:hypothetical protein
MLANTLALRTTGRPGAVTGEVGRLVREQLTTGAVANMTTMDDLVDESIVPERIIATLSSFFSGLGASLVALGLYGLLAYTVTRRASEIAIRMALGAAQSDISRTSQRRYLDGFRRDGKGGHAAPRRRLLRTRCALLARWPVYRVRLRGVRTPRSVGAQSLRRAEPAGGVEGPRSTGLAAVGS